MPGICPSPVPTGCRFWFRTPGPAGLLLASDFSAWGGLKMVPAHWSTAGGAVASEAREWLDKASGSLVETSACWGQQEQGRNS